MATSCANCWPDILPHLRQSAPPWLNCEVWPNCHADLPPECPPLTRDFADEPKEATHPPPFFEDSRNRCRRALPHHLVGPRSRRPAASERIVMGGIGIGNKGRGDHGASSARRRAVRGRVRRARRSPQAARPRSTSTTATRTARPTTTSASCWPAPTSTPSTSPRPTIGTRSS